MVVGVVVHRDVPLHYFRGSGRIQLILGEMGGITSVPVGGGGGGLGGSTQSSLYSTFRNNIIECGFNETTAIGA